MKIFLWGLFLAAVLCGIMWDRYPLADAQARLDSFPLKGLGFAGQSLPLSEIEEEYLTNVNILKRHYLVGNQQVFMTAMDGTHNRGAVHDPTYCYVGGGWRVIDRERVVMTGGGEAEKIVLDREGSTREVMLWFSDGQRQFAGVPEYWLRATFRRLSFGYSGAEPVRIIMQPVGQETVDWKKLMRDFVPLQDL